jgi:AcrR family transcriptional regulator
LLVPTLLETIEPVPAGLAVRKKARTRQALADAATVLFHERGYDATTIEDIAAAADVSTRTFYRYFPTKEDLVVAMGQTSLESFFAALEARPPTESLLDAVRVAVDQALVARWVDTASIRSFLALVRDTPAFRARWVEEAYDNRYRLAQVISRRTDGNPIGLRNLLIAGAITLAINTALQCWCDQDAEPDPAVFVHQALNELATPLLEP